MNRGRNRTAVSISVTCPLFESELSDCIAFFDALTTTTAAGVHDLVCSRLSSSWWWEQSPLHALCRFRFCDFCN